LKIFLKEFTSRIINVGLKGNSDTTVRYRPFDSHGSLLFGINSLSTPLYLKTVLSWNGFHQLKLIIDNYES
jgi:hypothetical protein